MKKVKEEVCAHYIGFGMCAKGLYAEETGGCTGCSQFRAADRKPERKSRAAS